MRTIVLSGFILMLAISTAGADAPADVGIVLQRGHTAPPQHVVVVRHGDVTLLETRDGVDVRVWRKDVADQPYRLLRSWRNQGHGWAALGGLRWDQGYLVSYADGVMEVFDHTGLQRRLHDPLSFAENGTTYLEVPHATDADGGLFAVDALNAQGAPELLLYRLGADGQFTRWTPPGGFRPVEFFSLNKGVVGLRDAGNRWRMLDLHRKDWKLAELPGCAAGARWVALAEGVLACHDPAAAEVNRWKLFRHRGAAWHDETASVSQPGLVIEDLSSPGAPVLRVQTKARNPETNNPGFAFFVDGDSGFRALAAAVPGAPAALRELRLASEGRLLGVLPEVEPGAPVPVGGWLWWLRDEHGGWRAVSAAVLPGLQEGRIADGLGWAFGAGIGLRVRRDDTDRWQWWLHQETGWTLLDTVIPELAGRRIAEIRDHRDGLIELLFALDDASRSGKAERTPPGNAWFQETSDGHWHSVAGVLRATLGRDDATILKVDARRDGLTVDYSLGGVPARWVGYLNGRGQWQSLDAELYDRQRVPRHTIFSRLSDAQPNADGDLLLTEKGDADWDGNSDETQLLHSVGGDWELVSTPGSDQGTTLRFDNARDLLVRTGRDGRRDFFLAAADGEWQDLRMLFGNRDLRILDAYAAVGGTALAAEVAAGEGARTEWRYLLRAGSGWRPLDEVLPDAFPRIQQMLGAGGVLSVQEAGDSNGNDLAFETRYYRVREGQWALLAMDWAGGPAVQEVREADGVLLTAREVWDADGNGRAFELRVALDQPGRAPLSIAPSRADRVLSDARSYGRGHLVVVGEADAGAEGTAFSSQVIETKALQVFERGPDGGWLPVPLPPGSWQEARLGASADVLALRAGKVWQLWQRQPGHLPVAVDLKTASEPLEWSLPSDERDVAYARVRRADDGESWERWHRTGGQWRHEGNSSRSGWWGVSSHKTAGGRLQLQGAQHWVDGVRSESIPEPRVWLHADARGSNGGTILRSPALMQALLSSPDAGNRSTLDVKAIGIGEQGTVLIYQAGEQLIAAAFTSGQVWTEAWRTKDGGAPLELLVNQYADGVRRLLNRETPGRGIYMASGRDGRVYFDGRGYFYNDTEAVTEDLGFRVGTELYSFSQLGSYLFRPDRLEEALGIRVGSLFELTERDRLRVVRARELSPGEIDVASLKPPHIQVTVKDRPQEQGHARLEITAVGAGVDEPQIEVRTIGAGQARSAASLPTSGSWRSLKLTREVPLLPGVNQIEVRVVDHNGLSDRQRLEIEYRPSAAVRPNLFAAMIGIGRYTGTDRLSSLPLTQNDAALIRKTLEDQAGRQFSKVAVRSWCQSDGCDAEPSRAQLESGVRDFLAQAKTGDYVLLYVSSHGMKIGSEYYMIPADGNPDHTESLVSWSDIQSWVRAAGLGKKVVILDTCHAGAVFDNERDKKRLVQQAAELDGVYVLSATAADASAYELTRLGSGLFTYVFHEGIEGAADSGSDGGVSFEELAFHIARRVREVSTELRVRMEPYVPILDQHLDFVLASVDARPRLNLRVSDLVSFDASAQPGRVQAWRDHLAKDAPEVVLVEAGASFRLTVVEDGGVPKRAQLAKADGTVLSQWTVTAPARPAFVGELSGLMHKVAGPAACAAKGVERRQTCGGP